MKSFRERSGTWCTRLEMACWQLNSTATGVASPRILHHHVASGAVGGEDVAHLRTFVVPGGPCFAVKKIVTDSPL